MRLVERPAGIGPASRAWEARVLPLYDGRAVGNSTAQAFMMNMNSAARAARLSAACSFASLAMICAAFLGLARPSILVSRRIKGSTANTCHNAAAPSTAPPASHHLAQAADPASIAPNEPL